MTSSRLARGDETGRGTSGYLVRWKLPRERLTQNDADTNMFAIAQRCRFIHYLSVHVLMSKDLAKGTMLLLACAGGNHLSTRFYSSRLPRLMK